MTPEISAVAMAPPMACRKDFTALSVDVSKSHRRIKLHDADGGAIVFFGTTIHCIAARHSTSDLVLAASGGKGWPA